MSTRSRQIRASRRAKEARRWTGNEKRPGVSTRPLECARQRDVVCKPFANPLSWQVGDRDI